MTSVEKFDNLLQCKKPNDRTEIPVYPMILTWCGACAGISQKEIVANPKKWQEAMDKTFEMIGMPDVYMPTAAGDVVFVMGLPSRLPGVELGDEELYQFVETSNMGEEDYKEIVKIGWNKWYNKYLMNIQKPPFKNQFQLIRRFIKMGGNINKNLKFFNAKGMAPIYHSAMAPAFDVMSMIRSMQDFTFDVMDEPGLIHDALRVATPEIDKLTITNVKRAKGNRVGMFAMRSSSTFVSPTMFEEMVWPYMKESIENYHKAGITTIIHCDANWLPMVKFFKEVPKGSVHLELDGDTDMFKTHEILEGWQSFRGDVPATMLAMGTPDQVSEYCEKIISTIGMKGGVMLGSGCEVPLNAKFENVVAMMNAVR